jgi:hypothetical protein
MVETLVAPKITIPRTPEWLRWRLDGARQGAVQIATDSRPFIHSIRELQEHKAWELYFDDEPKTWERFCAEAIKAEPAFVAMIDEGVKVLEDRKHQGPITERQAIEAAEAAKPNPKHGEIGNGRASRGYNVTPTRGNSPSYLAARIARDRPDILEGMKAGKYRSVRAAGIDAGIVKVPPLIDRAKKAFLKLSRGEREKFLRWLAEHS